MKTYLLPRKVKPSFVLAVSAVLLFLLSYQAIASMFGIPKKEVVHLTPKVQGRVTHEGKPLAGLEVLYTLTYGEDQTISTKTDGDGYFQFPEKTIESRRPHKLFDESRVFQEMYVRWNNQTYTLWYTVLPGITSEKVVEDKLKNLDCDLINPEKEYHFDRNDGTDFTQGVFSICKFD
ncbi:hypothetical protein PVT67_15815 [Gallaecimonas kandeliae]|uniref:DUF6795 domain-containing protein n=1 Tax=Gallaecimonas kandeliae TaxID=3029055 RepID=UPI002647FDA5|nr:DUF6795 domain-containing protein [Gallaecimonas kandeliae]WKE65110.1 hypothetical protein PVT67_15815 [Gallaecimonas kandeliae]